MTQNLLAKKVALALEDFSVYRGSYKAVSNANMSFTDGELVALIGRNGAGKSSILLAISGLTRFTGKMFIGKRDCNHGHHQPGVGYVPQRADLRWDLPLRAIDVVITGMSKEIHLTGFRKKELRRKLALQALADVDASHLADRILSSLSGGQAQRVLIARSLVSKPEILLLDEPLSGLDQPSADKVMQVLRQRAQEGTLIIAAMHELDVVNEAFTRAILLANNIVSDGKPTQLLSELYGNNFANVNSLS